MLRVCDCVCVCPTTDEYYLPRWGVLIGSSEMSSLKMLVVIG